MLRKLKLVGVGLLSAVLTQVCVAKYTTDWIANTYGSNATRVGNAARSLWVAPEGTVYTASAWDENQGSIAIYKAGKNAGSIGTHGGPTGDAITGNTTYLWVGMGFNRITGIGYTSGRVYRYNRSTGVNDQQIAVSADTTERRADVITGLATWGQFWAASDHPGNRVRLYRTDGTWVRDIAVTSPGALAFDRNGNIWVAQGSVVQQYSQTGTRLNTLQLTTGSVASALYFDPTTEYLWIGDAGPDQNIKVYSIHAMPPFVKTFGVQGGYLDTTTGIKGQVGSLRFARIDGIGKDAAGNLYILSEPWGKTWDNGRTGGTDLYAYNPSGTLLYTLQSLNFESIGAPDPSSDATMFYSGTNIYSGTGGADWKFVANTVDPFTYPADPRINVNDRSRGEHFGQIATVGSNRILVAAGQNPDRFYFFHFNPAASGYIAIPDGVLPGTTPFNVSGLVTYGFDLASNGDVWAGLDRTGVITHWPLTGFDSTGKPSWGSPTTYAIPTTLGVMARIIYLPESDTMILADRITGSTDPTSIGTRVEVYHGWMAGNQTSPVVITLTNANPKALSAAGNYLFVGYVHTVPNVDAFNLTSGKLDNTFTNSNSSNVYVGNDVDSMYGIRATLRSNGEYVVTKDDYNGTSIVVYRWTP